MRARLLWKISYRMMRIWRRAYKNLELTYYESHNLDNIGELYGVKRYINEDDNNYKKRILYNIRNVPPITGGQGS